MMKCKFCLIICLLLIAFPARTQNDSSGYFTSFDGTRIYYEQKGKGETIVLIHGFIVSGDSWKKTTLYQELIAAGYHVLLFDMRGNGKSDKPHTATAYQQDAEAKDIMGILDYLNVKKYIAIGYSRGSIITARLLVLDSRVLKAVIGGMGDGFTDPDWPRRILFYKALSGETVKELEGMVKYVKESGLDQQALALLQKEQPATVPSELKNIKQPLLVICGDKDLDNGSPLALKNLVPLAQLEIVPGDHGSTLRSVPFSKAVMEFIRK